jgi:hypothetical protein
MGEAYQTLSELDDPRARSIGQLGLRWTARERTLLRIDATYGSSNRPADVFTDSGLELGREHSTTQTASAYVEQGLGTHSKMDAGYVYRLGKVGGLEDDFQAASARLWRRFSRRTELGLGWSLEHRLSETAEQNDANVVTAWWNQGLSRRLSLAASAGARLSEGFDPRLEAQANISWTRARWDARVRYSHSQAYVPRSTDLAGRLSTSDTVGLTLTYKTSRLRFSLSPTYYWTRNSSLDIEVGRALAEVTFLTNRWLGLTAAYSHQRQTGTQIVGASPQDASGSRGYGVVGILIAPWNRYGAEDLP